MKIFLSFSGDHGLAVAQILNNWLPSVINAAQPWLSNNMHKGAGWRQELDGELRNAQCGIVCLTPEAEHAPWVLFEAGALSQKLSQKKGREIGGMFTFLVERPTTEGTHPLSHFQATRFSMDDAGREEMRLLLHSLVEFVIAADEPPPPPSALKDNFDKVWWPQLLEYFRSAAPTPAPATGARSKAAPQGGLKEMLDSTRRMVKKPKSVRSPGRDYTSVISNALNVLAIPETNHRADGKRRQALDELANLQEPNDRAVTILTGRLHRSLRDLKTAVDFLNVILQRRARRKKQGRDEADFHYNRACYQNLQAQQASKAAVKESLRARAWEDLRVSVRLWPLNLEEARADPDLKSLPGRKRRFDDLAGG